MNRPRKLKEPFDLTFPLGNAALLGKEPALLLNSRQSKTPVGSDGWVRNTIEAARDAIHSGFPLVASVGMNTWELVLWAAGEFRGKAIVICPLRPDSSPDASIVSVAVDFALEPEEHAWMFVEQPPRSRSAKAWWDGRDRLAFRLARHVVPVCIRAGGRMEKLFKQELRDDQTVDLRFRTGYKSRSKEACRMTLPTETANFEDWGYLTHWTRRCYGPWPAETSANYYRAIAACGESYPRSAVCTLKRILQERTIRGSGARIRNGTPVVAFTALDPCGALSLMRWRKRFVRPTFEPYGIAIHSKSAQSAGIRPVTYVKSDEKPQEGAPEMIQGYGTGDWPAEKEWRSVGEVNLAEIPDEDVLVLVPSERDADEFRGLTRYRVQPLTCGLESP